MSEKESFNSRIDLGEFHQTVTKAKAEMAKIIVGQEELIELMLTAMLADGHVLIEGVPGVAKTLSAKVLARIISADFSRIQFTPDLMPSDILGTSVFNMKTTEFEFHKGPIFSNIILIDEINRSPAKTQAALFEVMEERQITIEGYHFNFEPPFLVMATQNPIEQEGTYRLPEAQLDRFLFKIQVNYPLLTQEVTILQNHHKRGSHHDLSGVDAILSKSQIIEYRAKVQTVHVEDHLFQYMAELVQGTRNHPGIFLGGSPRASIALLRASRAYAVLQGRDFITPEDIKFLVPPVLRHRIMITPEKEMEGVSAEDILKEVIDQVEVPR